MVEKHLHYAFISSKPLTCDSRVLGSLLFPVEWVEQSFFFKKRSSVKPSANRQNILLNNFIYNTEDYYHENILDDVGIL